MIRRPPRSTLFPYTTSSDLVGIGKPSTPTPPGHFWIREKFRVRPADRSEEHTSELQSQSNLVCRLLLEKKKPHYRARRRHVDLHIAPDLAQHRDHGHSGPLA